MLKEVQMPPGVLAEIMGLAKITALRTGELATALTG
jgi:hypothetical protein